MYTDRDPEAEAEEKVEEEKLPGVEEVGPAAIESGFGGGGDWEAAPTGTAAAQPEGWDEAAPGQQFDSKTGGAQWGDDAGKNAEATTW